MDAYRWAISVPVLRQILACSAVKIPCSVSGQLGDETRSVEHLRAFRRQNEGCLSQKSLQNSLLAGISAQRPVRIGLRPQPATRAWSSRWRGTPQNGEASAPFRPLPTLQARKASRELTYFARTRRIFSGCPDGSVGSRDRASQRPDRASHQCVLLLPAERQTIIQ